jgi:Beta-galactosidase/beta-glucuronidase
MLDTICKVYINSELAFISSNAHLGGSVDVKRFVHGGENELLIVFDNPVEYIRKEQAADKIANLTGSLAGKPHIRKPQSHFGWDWGPILPTVGVLRDIKICAFDYKIDDVTVRQTHADGKVKLDVEVNSRTLQEKAVMLFVDVAAPDGKVILNKAQALKSSNLFTFEISKPQLWWTNDIKPGEQPLYEIRAYIVKDEIVEDKTFKTIGLRTIELERNPDEYGKQFMFKINGVPLFIKGANWIPADSMIDRFDDTRLAYLINAVKYANMNMLRVWGGGFYESDEFYDACDRAGVLVWQDCCFACAYYPFYNESFLESVKAEIGYNVKRLMHHASLAVWSGNNEVEMNCLSQRSVKKHIEWTKKFYYDILPSLINAIDGVTPYVAGSPVGEGYMKKVNSDDVGDTHLWHVWHGLRPLTYYRKRKTRFCSEFGLESLCDIHTVEQFAGSNEAYSLKSEVFKAHQKCISGNDKMLFYISTKFRVPESFKDTVYLSQLIQNECVSDATEHWRRNRGRCNGSMFWQLNDCWPVTSWSSIDYYGRFKALQYRARHFNAPQSVSIENGKYGANIYVINDKNEVLTAEVQCRLASFEGTVILDKTERAEINAASSVCLLRLNLKNEIKVADGNCVLFVKLVKDGKIINEKTALFMAEKKLTLPKAKLSLTTEFRSGYAFVTVKTDVFARFVKLDAPLTPKPFSDNFFDLAAGEERTVVIELPEGVEESEFASSLTAESLADVVPKGSRAYDFFLRQKIRLKPVNIGYYFGYFFV